MSSSASANTFGFNTFTTFFTTDTNNDLPLYSDCFAGVPFLDDTFPSSIFGTSSQVNFEYDSSHSFGYSFLIRDERGCIQAKGDVTNSTTTLQNVNGEEMLKITKTNRENETNAQTFEIRHSNRNIGTVRVADSGPASTCLQITHNNANPDITVRSLKLGDFAIFRPNSTSSPLCNIQLPNSDVYNSGEFNGTIFFHPATGITTEEQLLCTAAAIAFKVTMKRKTENDETQSNVLGYGLGILLTILIIVGCVALFNYMESRSCERRKAAGFSGYVNREC